MRKDGALTLGLEQAWRLRGITASCCAPAPVPQTTHIPPAPQSARPRPLHTTSPPAQFPLPLTPFPPDPPPTHTHNHTHKHTLRAPLAPPVSRLPTVSVRKEALPNRS